MVHHQTESSVSAGMVPVFRKRHFQELFQADHIRNHVYMKDMHYASRY
jgi:hypothetical protein